MRKWLEVRPGGPLNGSIKAPGSKNSALGLLAACCLGEQPIHLENVPDIQDVRVVLDICRDIGIGWNRFRDAVVLDPSRIHNAIIDWEKSMHFRAAYYFIGGLLAKMGKVSIGYPGGDSIGNRPIDQHIKGFEELGARVINYPNHYVVEARQLKGADIYFDVISSGATINLMLAAVLAKGRTILHNAARDPEIVDIAVMLNEMGAKIQGAGTHSIRIDGVPSLSGCYHMAIPDRLAAATYLLGGAITGGSVTVTDVIPEHLESYLQKLKEIGLVLKRDIASVTVQGVRKLKPVVVRTGMYPVLGSDYQQPLTALLTQVPGVSLVQDRVFPERFQHVNALRRMGADIQVHQGTAAIRGKSALKGSWVQCSDIRAGACLILAGCTAQGTTRITGLDHIARGHEDIVKEFKQLGADIKVCMD